jgi:hypothetical protein
MSCSDFSPFPVRLRRCAFALGYHDRVSETATYSGKRSCEVDAVEALPASHLSLFLRQLRARAHIEVCESQSTRAGREEEECLPVRGDIWGEIAESAVDSGAKVDRF